MWFVGFGIFIKHIFSHELQTHDNHSTFYFYSAGKKTNDYRGAIPIVKEGGSARTKNSELFTEITKKKLSFFIY